jgi:hypothetical protein
VVETYTDYKTYMFCFLGFIANIPNGGISNVSCGVATRDCADLISSPRWSFKALAL